MTTRSDIPYRPPRGRASVAELTDLQDRVRAVPRLPELLECFPGPAVILDEHRQIVQANGRLAALLARPRTSLVGLRPGEALSCAHACVDEGCGTTVFCEFCGAALAMSTTAATGQADERDCRIARHTDADPPALDIRVSTTPLSVDGRRLTVFAIRDVTDEKRRQVLERMFFHDVLNAAGGLKSLLEVWPELEGAQAEEVRALAVQVAAQLVDEIEGQRDLAAAERGELAVRVTDFRVADLLELLAATYRHHTAATGRVLTIERCRPDAALRCDVRLLSRVLGNLVKNALEASVSGGRVTVTFDDGRPETPATTFTVHNAGVIPPDVQRQLFQRSFSTKGEPGRGIGTYSARLLTERYLGGRISFRSTAAEGTSFVVELP